MKAYHTMKEKKTMTKLQEFVVEGNEKADELVNRRVERQR